MAKTQSNKAVQMLEKVPYRFWFVVTLALSAGLLSLVAMQAVSLIDSKKLDSDYPVYDQLLIDRPDQREIYKELTGAWYLKKETAEMIIEFYEDGFFSWEMVDSASRYTKLFAAGHYAKTTDGRLLFSQMRELGLPFDPHSPGLKTHHLALDEVILTHKTKRESRRGTTLIIDIPDEQENVNSALIRLMENLSEDNKTITLRLLGEPIMYKRNIR